MKHTPLIDKAIAMSAKLHREQLRRDDDIPYAMHPYAAAFIISPYTDDEHTIAAALLHDVLEDVHGYEYEHLVEDFGTTVARIVKEVTEDRHPSFSAKKDRETWRYRKEQYLENLKGISQEGMLVAAGDKYHNLYSLINGYTIHSEGFWKKFHAPDPKRESIMWFYKTAIDILDMNLNSEIIPHMRRLYEEAETNFYPNNIDKN